MKMVNSPTVENLHGFILLLVNLDYAVWGVSPPLLSYSFAGLLN
jgi:hypothetical protein